MANQVPPASQPSPTPTKTRRDTTPIIVALISLTGTFITVMMSSPLIVKYFDRRMAAQATSNPAMFLTLPPPSATLPVEAEAVASTETAAVMLDQSTDTTPSGSLEMTPGEPFDSATPADGLATSPTDTVNSVPDDASPETTEIVAGSPFPQEIVSARWDEGYYLTGLAYGNGEWALVFSKDTGYTTQGWNIVDTDPEPIIEQRWQDGFDLTGLAYNPEGWVLIFSKGTGYSDQAWRRDPEFPDETIRSRWEEGFSVTGLAYGNGEWSVIFSKAPDFTDQAWKLSDSYPADVIRSYWDEGAAITSLAFGEEQWAVVFTEGSNLGSQAWLRDEAFPETDIDERWNQGKDITALAFGAGEWALVFSEGAGYSTQAWNLR